MSNRTIDPGVSIKTYDVLNFDVRKVKSRSSNIVSALTTSQSLPQSVINDDFVKKNEVPPYDIHQREAKRQRQSERSKTKGKNWFHMPAPEMTEEKKTDLMAIQMRGGLYADKFFKKGSDTKGLPKYFQTGTVVDNPADFYRRIPKKDRKKTILEELYDDVKVRKFSKKRYVELKEKNRRRIASIQHSKRLRHKKK
ncbi:unnamed protein product [Rotaria magnacalcarata]|uniref:Fcf2 pre-rRNA processing C-terminal domain-containing protein n=1 Tax=Rotaria magnacalcarata TaxID=392030 RepID=A0A816LH70_9BILA|nr:unnamed protein product [Rotaria magnacalcarata]CAF1416288.1 unnamed protein product [Rotaria magnacalcarata]CAF1953000.1 unnamed protein product [Rotaria magnacalcarata]CAF2072486.1 unnamed protein product [Rotaria magnacalcarata]CAF2199979.1 unnamed protein product [Rotaria magnacalcarata]